MRYVFSLVLMMFGIGCLQTSQYGSIDLGGSYLALSQVNINQQDLVIAKAKFQTSKNISISRIAFEIEDPTCAIEPKLAQADAEGIATINLHNCQVGQHRLNSSIFIDNYRQELNQERYIQVFFDTDNEIENRNFSIPIDTYMNNAITLPINEIAKIRELSTERSIVLHMESTDLIANYSPPVPLERVLTQWGQLVLPSILMFRTEGEQSVIWRDEQGAIWAEQKYQVKGTPISGQEMLSLVIPDQVRAGVPFSPVLKFQGSLGRKNLFANEQLFWQTNNPNAILSPYSGELLISNDSVQRIYENMIAYTSGEYVLKIKTTNFGTVEARYHVLPGPLSTLEWTGSEQAIVQRSYPVTLQAFDVYSNAIQDITNSEISITLSDISATKSELEPWTNGMLSLSIIWQATGVQSLRAMAPGLDDVVFPVRITAPISSFSATYPAQVSAGSWFDIQLQALDVNQQIAAHEQRIVVFTTTDANGTIPSYAQFSAGQVELLQVMQLKTLGVQKITIKDITNEVSDLVLDIEVLANEAVGFVIAPIVHPVPINQATPVRVIPIDSFGNTVMNYQGMIHLNSLNPNLSVSPTTYTFVSSPVEGIVLHPGVILHTSSAEQLQVNDPLRQLSSLSQPIFVRQPTSLKGTQDGGGYCVVFDDGVMKCWGKNAPVYLGAEGGILGYGDTLNRGDNPNHMGYHLPSVDVGLQRKVLDIPGANRLMNCAILDTRDVKCWGGNGLSQLGLGDKLARGSVSVHMGDNLPVVNLGSNQKLLSVTIGGRYIYHAWACGILTSGQIKCWGSNELGQLGLDDTATRGDQLNEMGDNLPVVNLGTDRTVIAIKAGGISTCAILDNKELKCWGSSQYYDEDGDLFRGTLGYGDSINRGNNTPSRMGNNLPTVNLGTNRLVKKMDLGTYHTCVVLDNEQVKCWGQQIITNTGTLGYGDNISRGHQVSHMGNNLPAVSLGIVVPIKDITCATYHSCVLTESNQVKCWGDNYKGQLGLGDTDPRGDSLSEMGNNLPYVDLGAILPIGLTATTFSTCALFANGRAKCWGGDDENYGFSGALGLGDNQPRGDDSAEMGDNLPWIEW